MFGYIKPDEPFLYKKDDVLYRSMYCGLCKGIGAECKQMARYTLTYDLTFFSIFAHNVRNEDIKINRERCAAHWIKRRNIAAVDGLTKKLGALNVILAYFKLKDNILDEGKGNLKSGIIKGGFNAAKRDYPLAVAIVEKYFAKLIELEGQRTESADIAADPFGCMLRELSKFVLEEYSTEQTEKMFYYLGKWIYLIDAVDDFDKDKKKKNYNVFAYMKPNAQSGKELIEMYGTELNEIFNGTFFALSDSYKKIEFHFNKDLIENILLRGIPRATNAVFAKSKVECCENNKQKQKAQEKTGDR